MLTDNKKGIFHSALAQCGPVTVTITCDGPQASKFAGKPPYISFKHEGYEHQYQIENDECGEALTGLKGQAVTIEATGSRDDARIEVSDAAERRPAQKPQQQRPQQRPAAQAGQPDPLSKTHKMTPEERAEVERDAAKAANIYLARCAWLIDRCQSAALKLMPKEASFEDVRATANTLFIEVKAVTDIRKLPMFGTKPAAPAPKPPEPEPEPPRRSAPPAAQDPAYDDYTDDDIPF